MGVEVRVFSWAPKFQTTGWFSPAFQQKPEAADHVDNHFIHRHLSSLMLVFIPSAYACRVRCADIILQIESHTLFALGPHLSQQPKQKEQQINEMSTGAILGPKRPIGAAPHAKKINSLKYLMFFLQSSMLLQAAPVIIVFFKSLMPENASSISGVGASGKPGAVQRAARPGRFQPANHALTVSKEGWILRMVKHRPHKIYKNNDSEDPI